MDKSAWQLLLTLLFLGFLYLIATAGTEGVKVIIGLIWLFGFLAMGLPTLWYLVKLIFLWLA